MSSAAPIQQATAAQQTSQLVTQSQQIGANEEQSKFTDLRPQTIAQRKLQDAANNSPQNRQLQSLQQMAQNSARATQLKTLSDMMNAATVQRVKDKDPLQAQTAGATLQREATAAPAEVPKPNNTGLPDNLKSGIESLSGMSMDHVKVHYNSTQPAQLNAHAYAQGSAIHVAPGQEQHLPHEAWHVVQQAKGTVKPTMQMKGDVPVNDDVSLEAEADVMGGKALGLGTVQSNVEMSEPTQSQRSGGIAANVIQRDITEHQNVDDEYKEEYNAYLDALDKAVEKAYFYALHYPTLKNYASLDGHTEYWAECWSNYRKGHSDMGLLAAAFGYAVETLATVVYLPAAPGRLSVELQGIRDKTRPDVVLKHNNKDVGWLDITAMKSKGHIWKKAGWKDKNIHLGEVAYPSLDPDVIQDNVDNNRTYDDKTDPKEVLKRVKYYAFMRNIRKMHWKNIGEKYFSQPLPSYNQGEKRAYIRRRLAEYLGLSPDELKPQMLGSVLYAMNVGYTKHGYNKKSAIKSVSRALGESILQQHDRELPGIEGYTDQISFNILSNEELAWNILVRDMYAHSGKTPFLTSTDNLERSTHDAEGELEVWGGNRDQQLISLESGSGNQIEQIGVRLSGFMRQTIKFDTSSLGKLYSHLNKVMKRSSLKNISVAVRLDNGSIVGGQLYKSGKFRIGQRHNKVIYTKKRREQIRREKRSQDTIRNYEENDNAPQSLPLITFGPMQVSQDVFSLLQEQGEGQIIGFAYTTSDNTLVAIGEDVSNDIDALEEV